MDRNATHSQQGTQKLAPVVYPDCSTCWPYSPTGLDSYTANEVMTVVRSLVSSGVTIIATIHSPTAYAFSLFDRMMMLVRGQVGVSSGTGLDAVMHMSHFCRHVKV